MITPSEVEMVAREVESAREELGASPGVSLGQAVRRVMAELKEHRAVQGIVAITARDGAEADRQILFARAEADRYRKLYEQQSMEAGRYMRMANRAEQDLSAARADAEALRSKLHAAELDQNRLRDNHTLLCAALGIPEDMRSGKTWDTLLGRVQDLVGDVKAYENRIDRLAEILAVPPISVVERVEALVGQISVADARVSAVERQLNAERDDAADQADELTQRELECAALVAAIRRDEDEIQRLRVELSAARRPA